MALAQLGASVYSLGLTRAAFELKRTTAKDRDQGVELLVGDTHELSFASGSFELVFSQGLI